MTIGLLALQGDFKAHRAILQRCAVSFPIHVVEVREARDLEGCDGLILPGGESTTMSRLCDRYELWQPLQENLARGMGALGTCAGMILLAKNIQGATQNFTQRTLGALDIDVARNAYGTQIESFEGTVETGESLNCEPLRGVFIRAPRIVRYGDVEILATRGGEPVAVRRGKIMAAAFHPEIAGETRLHELWLASLDDQAANRAASGAASGAAL